MKPFDYFTPHHRKDCPDKHQTFCGHCHECGDLIYAFLMNGDAVCQHHHKEAMSAGPETSRPRTKETTT